MMEAISENQAKLPLFIHNMHINIIDD